MALDDFNGAVAVITGGAGGIGLATAQALHAVGAHVVLADLNAEALALAAEQVRANAARTDAKVLTVAVDVTDDAQVRALMHEALGLTGKLDLVVACAGIGRGGTIEEFASADARKMLDVNVMGIYNCVQAAVPAMKQQRRGHFVLISSVAGKLGVPMLSAYCASKWAVRGFSHAMRAELYGTGVGITTVFPAWVDTPMFKAAAESGAMPIEVMLTPQQVAEAILQAVRDDTRDLTLAPNPDIAMLIERTQSDPDRAEDGAGRAYFKRTHDGALPTM